MMGLRVVIVLFCLLIHHSGYGVGFDSERHFIQDRIAKLLLNQPSNVQTITAVIMLRSSCGQPQHTA